MGGIYAAGLWIGVLVSGAADPLSGQWAGERTNLTIESGRARIEQDCASGSFGPVRLDGRGHFSAQGVYQAEGPGPQAADTADFPPSSYEGVVTGDQMQLTVRPAGGAPFELTLVRGRAVKLVRCL
jgi:hypothetical protein